MFGRKKKNPEVEKLRKWYEEELKRKDRLIAELRGHNLILMKAALKQAEKREELDERIRKSGERK